MDVIGGLLKGYIEQGFTRSIRVIGADDHWSSDDLKRLAGSKNRKVEHIEDGKSSTGVCLIPQIITVDRRSSLSDSTA